MTSFARIRSRVQAIRYKTYVRSFSGLVPYYIVNEFPKSGGTWLSQMLADVLELPFPRNRSLSLEPSIVHGHFLHPFGLHNTVVLWRDPRDLIVSFYYHCYFLNEHHNQLMVKMMKQKCPFEDYQNIQANLPEFIHFINTRPISPRFTWAQFVQRWQKSDPALQTSYEELRGDAVSTLRRIVENLTGREYDLRTLQTAAELNSFERAKKKAIEARRNGVESSFIRQGAVGGWRKCFSTDAEALCKRYYGAGMTELNYSW